MATNTRNLASFTDGETLKIPVYADDAARNSAIDPPTVGMLIYNTGKGVIQQYNAEGWASVDSPPTVSALDYPGDDTALDTVGEFALASSSTTDEDATVTVSSTANLKVGMLVTGTGIPAAATVASITNSTTFELSANATATGTVTLTFNTQTLVISGTNFQTGATVTIDGTAPSTVTRNSSSQITVTGTPAKTAGTYADGVRVTNPTGLAASINVDYSPLPGWTSHNSGNLLDTFITGSDITEIDLVAADATSYALTNQLPPGLAMNPTTGNITGTVTGTTAATYNFTVTATDAEAQSSPRLFNIIIKGPFPTGGNTIDESVSGYRIHIFTSGGTFTTTGALSNVEYLIIAGGGGGASNYGGGGGAGGYRCSVVGENTGGGGSAETRLSVTAGSHTVVVGDGGAGAPSAGPGTVGGDSSFFGITSSGGGYGGGPADTPGGPGGSAGGGSKTAASGARSTPTQGNVAGVGTGINGGGGGGAGAAGSDDDGGNGLSSSITGSPVTRGGGGGGYNGGSGGSGGGGGHNVAGTVNTGGGGGADTASGGQAGGSGIVIIRYAV